MEIRNQPKSARKKWREEVISEERLPTLEELEKAYIEHILKVTDYNKSKAARILSIHPTSLFRKLKSNP